MNKWEDYDLDLQNGNVSGTFTSGSNNVVVSYKNGSTNWIYPNLAKETLSSTSYPRINVGIVSDSGIRIGTEAGTPADIYETIRFQVDIWVKERYTYSDGTITHAGPHLAMYLARQMIKAFEDSIGELYPLLHDFELINLTDAKWEVDREVFHVIVEFSLEGSSVAG
ncbi:MAG: hypothetical protein KKD77_20175 [Gammaproteobacteria bacterium]|nr:hypothetical protein [Gammaproteobacteria bacterium]